MSEETNVKVMSLLENIKSNHNGDKQIPTISKIIKSSKAESKKKLTVETVRGRPKSNRFWKSPKEKFSTINKTSGLRQDFAKKTALRLELQRTKNLSKQIQDEIKQRELQRKERRRQNIKKTEENKRKAEVVQVITNPAKIKRLRKKQLRFIEKRDTTKVENAK